MKQKVLNLIFQGATLQQISRITNKSVREIQIIIKEYVNDAFESSPNNIIL